MPVAAVELAKLFPLDALRPETREQLGLEASITEYRRNENIFNAGDLDEEGLRGAKERIESGLDLLDALGLGLRSADRSGKGHPRLRPSSPLRHDDPRRLPPR